MRFYSLFSHCFFFLCMFLATSGTFLIIFSSAAPHRGQPTAKSHPRWQPTRRLAVSCRLERIRTQDCRTTARHATAVPPCLQFTLFWHHSVIDKTEVQDSKFFKIKCWIPLNCIFANTASSPKVYCFTPLFGEILPFPPYICWNM